VPLESKRTNSAVTGHPVPDGTRLAGIRRRLRADLNRLEVDAAQSFDCLVAVTEACTNALLHGARGSDDPPPHLSWEIDRDSARFYIQDFSNRQWSMAAHPSGGFDDMNPEDLEHRIGGLGLPIMRALMDDVNITIDARGTTVVMTKNFN
jgi:serine/threonine-protein kinase RsbW